MDNNCDEWFIIMQASIEANKQKKKANNQDSDDKTMKLKEDFKAMIASSIISIMDHINTLKSSPTRKDSPKPPEHTTVVPETRRDPPLDSGQYKKIGSMWNLEREISSPKFYELLIKTELKGDTALDLNNFYNHINICLN